MGKSKNKPGREKKTPKHTDRPPVVVPTYIKWDWSRFVNVSSWDQWTRELDKNQHRHHWTILVHDDTRIVLHTWQTVRNNRTASSWTDLPSNWRPITMA